MRGMIVHLPFASLADRAGTEIGVSDWLPITPASRIRARFTLASVEKARDGIQVAWGVVIEREGHDQPCVVLDWKIRYYPDRQP